MTRVLVAGVSTRAAADSAARAGFDVTALDAYADRDQHPGVRALALARDFGCAFSAENAAAVAATLECEAVAYLSNFENDPGAVARLAEDRSLWGNAPDILRRIRDPFLVFDTFQRLDVPCPEVARTPSVGTRPNGWIVKPFSSGGGHGVRDFDGSTPLPKGFYLQQRVEGTPGSVIFVCTAGRTVSLAVSRQLIGDERFGATGYRYCGNILAPDTDPQFADGVALHSAARRLAEIVGAEFALTGVNGIDFIARGGVPYPIEINPRWSASMELVERAGGGSVFAVHAAACGEHDLPASPPGPRCAVGKAIVFARRACVAGDTDAWLADPDIRDVPHRGDPLTAGGPVCTVFGEAADATSCESALVARADRIYADMRRWR